MATTREGESSARQEARERMANERERETAEALREQKREREMLRSIVGCLPLPIDRRPLLDGYLPPLPLALSLSLCPNSEGRGSG